MTEYIQEIIDNLFYYTNKLFLDCYANLEELDQFIETELKEPEPITMTREIDSEPEEHHIDILDLDWDLV